MLNLKTATLTKQFPAGESVITRLNGNQPLASDVTELPVKVLVNAIKTEIYLATAVQQEQNYQLNRIGFFNLLDAFARGELPQNQRARLSKLITMAASDMDAFEQLNNLDETRLARVAAKFNTDSDTLVSVLATMLNMRLKQASIQIELH